MKAIVQHKYGSPDVLELQEVDKPVLEDDRVLVRVHGACVNPYDWHMMRAKPHFVRLQAGMGRPKHVIQGADFAGTIEAVGEDITRFQPGDEVFGACVGAFAEYVSASERSIAPKPANVSFEQAASVPMAGITALQALRKGRIKPGAGVLVNGASGGVGTFAVQIAKSFGADVTGVCSATNVGMVRSIGADHVVDYTREDFTDGAHRYDVILDNVGTHSMSDYKRVLSSSGVYVAIGALEMGDWLGPLSFLFKVLFASLGGRRRMVPMLASTGTEDLVVLSELIEAGDVTPVIDRSYELGEVPDAIRYLEEGHARGKVVIVV
jgi:NADPH:quinone reductase-like Zn-dependent oxidoreductase